jgi:hypothetical protein
LSRASASVILIAGADKMDSAMLRISNLHHQCDDNPMMRDSSALAADASNDGMMLGRDVVRRDRVRLEDIGLDAATKIEEGARQGRRILRRQ